MRSVLHRTWMLQRTGLAVLLGSCAGTGGNPPSDPPVYTVREEWRFVASDSSPATSLTQMLFGTLLPDGRLVTLHLEPSAVRVFDSAGRSVRIVGREGRGPGEYRYPGVAGLVGDTLWISQLGGDSYILFDRQLEPAGQVRTDRSSYSWFGVVTGGRTVSEPDRDSDTSSRVIGIYDSQGNLVKPIPFDTLRDEAHRFDLRIEGRLRSFASPVVSTARFLVVPGGVEGILLDPGPLWAEVPGRITMRRVRFPSGDPSPPREIALPPRRVTAADRDTLIARATRSIRPYESDYRAVARFPDFYPPFQWFDLIGLDGSLWLREYAADDRRLVLDSTGAPLMRVTLPKGLRVLAATRTHVWGTLPDADDVPIVLRYRIVPP